jgi:hypothetical protein
MVAVAVAVAAAAAVVVVVMVVEQMLLNEEVLVLELWVRQ